ncbi:MAG TPA: PEP-CTERM sorting domain-containing protein, partial [Vicinamibacterales bacterium]
GAHDLAITFDQIPATIPAGGVALTICTDLGRVCGDPASGINIPSGELVRNPTASDPFGGASRQVTGGFFTVSDPPGSISLNFTLDPVLIPVDNTGGGGTGTPVPEPATMSLFALGAALAVGSKRNRRKASLEA